MITSSLLQDSRIKRIIRERGRLAANFFELVGDPSPGTITEVRPLRALLEPNQPGVKDIEVVRIMQDLEERGFGTFTTGRRGKPSRFEWGGLVGRTSAPPALASPAPPRQQYPAALGLEIERAPAPSGRGLPAGPVTTDGHRFLFRLRKDYLVDFELPIDFSSEEAQRLCNFIKALPASVETSSLGEL